MAIHALIVNYDSADDVVLCVASLVEGCVETITIVDNCSPGDDLMRLYEVASDDRVSVIRSEFNRGFAGGVNFGISAVSAQATDQDFLWILNPDVIVEKNAEEVLSDALRSGVVDIVSPAIQWGPPDNKVPWFTGGELDLQSGETRHMTRPRSGNKVASSMFCSFLTGTALMASLSTWQKLRGFREDLFLYWEDADLSLRAVNAGLRLGVCPGSNVWHRVGGSSKGAGRSAAYYYYINRNRLLVCRGSWRVFGKGSLRRLWVTLRWIYWAFRDPSPTRDSVVAVIRGIRDGLRGRSGRSLRYSPVDPKERHNV